MAKSGPIPAPLQESDEMEQVQAEIQHYLDEIARSIQRMQEDQPEIARMKERTRAMLAELANLRAAR